MIGGPDGAVERLDPVFASLAPGLESAERTPGRSGDPSPSENGYLHCGPNGAGHFVKMVHNGIEYGLMAAYAEGLNILNNANAGKVQREADAETAPLEQPEYYQYDLVHLGLDRKSTRLNSSHTVISYAVFCLNTTRASQPSRGHSSLPSRALVIVFRAGKALQRHAVEFPSYPFPPHPRGLCRLLPNPLMLMIG